MSSDDFSSQTHAADPRTPAIRAARAQFEAALLRQRRLAEFHPQSSAGGGPAPPPTALPGYTLLRELHRGGQGVVYLGVQTSTGRNVAVKILNCSPLTGPAAAALARFEQEVEILTRLRHPNIVTIHDCGRDPRHVFLVMDYVAGQPLDAHVSRGRAPLGETLALFARICDGVNAAHLRGVIHRDLKPGNILVDGQGEPHVLDFGLAKLVDRALDADSAQPMTVTGQFVGSLPWASPEQAEGRGDELDVRTDVYSLGVVFYQALTGRFPYPVAGRLTDVVRAIAEADPARPSALVRGIDRELETILLKCLAKAPERRYQNAGELARDIRRYLAGEPIEARRDSLAYVAKKQLARYRVAAIAAALVLVAVSLGLVVSLTFWRQAAKQHDLAQASASAAQAAAERADREAEQAQAVNEFMRTVLTSVDPHRQGANVRLVEVLDAASASAGERFAAHPLQEALVRDLLGQIYANLSLWHHATVEYGRSHALWRDHAGPDDPRTLQAHLLLIGNTLNMQRLRAAEHALADLLPRMERVFGAADPRTLDARRYVAIIDYHYGRTDRARQTLLELRAHPALLADDARQVGILQNLIDVGERETMDDPVRRRASLAPAKALAAEWLARATRLYGPDATPTLEARVRVARLDGDLGRYAAAVETCRTLLDGTAERLGECHAVRFNAMQTLADALTRLGERDEPAALFLRIIECRRARNDVIGLIAVLSESMGYLDRGGRAAEGEARARELAESLAEFGGGHGEMVFDAELYVARFVSLQGRLAEADALFGPLLERSATLQDQRLRARLHLFHGSHLARHRLFQAAEQELSSAADLLDDIRQGTLVTHPDDLIVEFIALYHAWGKPERAAEYEQLLTPPADRAAGFPPG